VYISTSCFGISTDISGWLNGGGLVSRWRYEQSIVDLPPLIFYSSEHEISCGGGSGGSGGSYLLL
jgi:hypothetical protein